MALAGIAGLISWASYSEAEPGDSYMVWSGGIFVGGVIALFGAIRFGAYIWEGLSDPEGRGPRFLLRTIVYGCSYVAAADGLNRAELGALQNILAEITGSHPSLPELDAIAKSWAASGFGDSDKFSGRLHLLDEDDRLLVLRCATFTAYADGEIGEAEERNLQELGQRLRVAKETIERLKRELAPGVPVAESPADGVHDDLPAQEEIPKQQMARPKPPVRVAQRGQGRRKRTGPFGE